jgi:hypothetical protein
MNEFDRATTFGSSTKITALISADDIFDARHSVTVAVHTAAGRRPFKSGELPDHQSCV